jgi:hypothetical protein
MPKQVQRGREGLRSVFDVRAVLLGQMRLQSGSDLVSGPQRRLHRVKALIRGTRLHSSKHSRYILSTTKLSAIPIDLI